MEIKSASMMETKSISPYVFSQISSQLAGYGGNYLSPGQAYWLWQTSDTVGSAVDLISWAFEQLNPILKDTKTGEYVSDHPFIELINNPGFKMGSDQFQYELMSSFLIAGETYPILEGNVNFEPTGMYSIKANDTSLEEGRDGWLFQITTSTNNVEEVYTREEIPKRRTWVYQKRDKLKETKQILNQSRRNDIRGQSVLERVYYQALSKYYGNIHNTGMLKNGSRPSGMFSPKQGLSQENYEAFRTEGRATLEGPGNTGRTIFSPGPVEYTNFILNPRDMDFIKLIENNRTEIYAQYGIPLPLVSSDTMTMNNYENAVYAFYDMALMPKALFLYKQLGKFALPRYKDGERFELSVNEKEIPALKERLFKKVKLMRETYAFMENEMRTEAGYEGFEGGDINYKPSNLIQSGEEDDYTLDNIRRNENERLDELEIEEPENVDKE